MAVYEISRCGQRVITHGTQGQCGCGKPADTEVQIGWVPEANAGAGGGQYDEVCFGCLDEVDGSSVVDGSESEALQDAVKESPRVEVCNCVEWVRENELDHDGIDEVDLDEATNTYISAVMTGLADKGFDATSAKNQRQFYHGWNGAHFTDRCGCVASWKTLTDEQKEVIVAVRIAAQKQTTGIWKSEGRSSC